MSTTSSNLHSIFPLSQQSLITACILCTVCILTSLIASFGLFHIWRLRQFPFIQKRHPRLVLTTCVCFILYLGVERPLNAFVRLSLLKSTSLQWIRWIIHVILAQTSTICILFRIYITCFDVSYAKTSADSLWMKHIDIDYKHNKTSWIVTNYQKRGKLSKIYPAIIALCIFSILLILIVSVFDFNIGYLLNGIFMIFWLLLMIILWCLTPRYLDFFKIRVEIRMLLCLQTFLHIINISYVILIGSDSNSYYSWLIIVCFGILFICALTFLQTLWVLNKFHIAQESKSKKQPLRVNSLSHSEDQNGEILELEIVDVISEQIGFESFMNHLNKEFSMENLLGVIEMTQYKLRYREIKKIKKDIENGIDPLSERGSVRIKKIVLNAIKRLSVDVNAEQKEEEFVESNDTETKTLKEPASVHMKRSKTTMLNVVEQTVMLPDHLPFSTIVYGKMYNANDREKNVENMKKMNLKKEAMRIINGIYEKYIFVGSEMELNLSHKLRQRCLDKLSEIDSMNEQKLEHMFDKTIAALLKLMQDSYLRFKESKEFVRYEEKVNKRKRGSSLITKQNLGGVFADLM